MELRNLQRWHRSHLEVMINFWYVIHRSKWKKRVFDGTKSCVQQGGLRRSLNTMALKVICEIA